METGTQLKVSSNKLEKPGIVHVTPGLQGEWFIPGFIHCTTVVHSTICCWYIVAHVFLLTMTGIPMHFST